ncbi:MAG: protease modulator HflK [Candidatus Latescibacteria bacterium]|nr:protease modulator HflK [Candidatus Latescibacterota bacterium]
MNEQQPLPRSTRMIYAAFDFVGQYPKRRILTVLTAIVLAVVLGSGFYVIKKEEEAVVLRFGKVVATDVGPGIHYCIPVIDEIHIRKVKRIVQHQIASKSGGTVNFTILSGDTNLFEVDIALQYRIDNLRNFLYATVDPLEVTALLLREELINIMGQNFIDLILTSNRNIIQHHLLVQIASLLEEYDVGIEVVSLNIVDISPIEETIAAFRDVNDAIAERAQAESNANRTREKMIAHSRGQAEAVVMDARARAQERIVQAQSSADAFLALLAEYKKQRTQVAITRYWQRMRTIFAEASLSAVNPRNEATIDINMIEGLAAHTPADILMDAPSGDAVERPSFSTARQQDTHTFENVDEDKHLLDGQFHKRRVERHHQRVANMRSLIFDLPSVFSHEHTSTHPQTTVRQADQQAVIETKATESVQDSSKTVDKEKKSDSAQ